MRNISKVYGVVLAVSCLAASFWGDLSRSMIEGDPSYNQRRTLAAFVGLPIEDIGKGLTSALPPGHPIALSPGILGNDLVQQRLTEGLYPRRIDRTSSVTLDVLPEAEFAKATDARPLVRARGHVFFIRGQSGAEARDSTRSLDERHDEATFVSWLARSLSVLGLGWLLLISLQKLTNAKADVSLELCLAFPAGAVVLGALFSVASWLQVPVSFGWARAVGWLALAGALALRRIDRGALKLRQTFASGLYGSDLAALSVVGAFFGLLWGRLWTHPIVRWDGRSVWLFQTKRLVLNGMVTLPDLLHPDSWWSLPDKPLAFPGLLAFFGEWSGAYSERAASLAIVSLAVACVAALWLSMRRQVGGFLALAVAMSGAVGVGHFVVGAYVDPYPMLLLAIGYALLVANDARAWIAVALAASFKLEGVFVSVLFVAGAHLLLRQRSWRGITALGLAGVPAAHGLWSKQAGFKGAFDGVPWEKIATEGFDRALTILETIPELLTRGPVLWLGACAVVASIAIIVATHRARDPRVWLGPGLGLIMSAMFCGILFLTPHDLTWHVNTALDRLLLHPMFLASVSLAILIGNNEKSPHGT